MELIGGDNRKIASGGKGPDDFGWLLLFVSVVLVWMDCSVFTVSAVLVMLFWLVVYRRL